MNVEWYAANETDIGPPVAFDNLHSFVGIIETSRMTVQRVKCIRCWKNIASNSGMFFFFEMSFDIWKLGMKKSMRLAVASYWISDDMILWRWHHIYRRKRMNDWFQLEDARFSVNGSKITTDKSPIAESQKNEQ